MQISYHNLLQFSYPASLYYLLRRELHIQSSLLHHHSFITALQALCSQCRQQMRRQYQSVKLLSYYIELHIMFKTRFIEYIQDRLKLCKLFIDFLFSFFAIDSWYFLMTICNLDNFQYSDVRYFLPIKQTLRKTTRIGFSKVF